MTGGPPPLHRPYCTSSYRTTSYYTTSSYTTSYRTTSYRTTTYHTTTYCTTTYRTTTFCTRVNGLKDGVSNEWFATFDLTFTLTSPKPQP